MAFTDDEKTRILRFLGYPDWQQLSQSIQLGFPAASQPLFLVFDSFNRMTPTAEERIRFDLCQCEAVENQMIDARSRLKASRIGDLHVDGARERRALVADLEYWTRRLADDLGVFPNPYAQTTVFGYGGGRNAVVTNT